MSLASAVLLLPREAAEIVLVEVAGMGLVLGIGESPELVCTSPSELVPQCLGVFSRRRLRNTWWGMKKVREVLDMREGLEPTSHRRCVWCEAAELLETP